MMTESNNNNNRRGVGTFGLLGVAFVVLKLTEVIDWSWWLVTMPFYFGPAIGLLVFLFAMLLSACGAITLPATVRKSRKS